MLRRFRKPAPMFVSTRGDDATQPKPLDPASDEYDAALFQFWCRAASYPDGWPLRLAEMFHEETQSAGRPTPAAYRQALIRLATEKRINLQ